MRLTGIALGEEPQVLEALGLAVEEDRATVGGVTLQAVGHGDGRGLLGLDLDGAEAGPLPTAVVPDGGRAGDDHPLGARAVDHVVVLCGDVAGTLADMGVEARRVEEREDRTYAYVLADTALLELVGPSEPDDRPPRLWGLALTVADVDAAAVVLGEACGQVRSAIQPGRRIATVRHERLGMAVPTVLLSPRA